MKTQGRAQLVGNLAFQVALLLLWSSMLSISKSPGVQKITFASYAG